jgi:predicted phage-related endonuclease
MIDEQLRALSVGGSEVAALVGLDPNRDAFAIYAEKLGLVEREPPTPRMRMGKRLERIIAEVYAEETGQVVVWCDQTIRHAERTWQAYTVDAFVLGSDNPHAGEIIQSVMRYPIRSVEPSKQTWEIKPFNAIGLMDAKNVSWDQYPLWGEAGTDQVPDRIACQIIWYLDATGLPWGDVAALFGGNDLRIYRINYDSNIADVLRGAAEEFVKNHLEPQIPPPIGHSDTAARYLKQKFPRNVEHVRKATPDEVMLLSRLKQEREVLAEAEARAAAVSNEVRQAIGDADGIKDPVLGKVTWRRTKDTIGTDWKAVAEAIINDLRYGAFPAADFPDLREYAELHQRVIREGSRRLLVPRTWKSETEDEDA